MITICANAIFVCLIGLNTKCSRDDESKFNVFFFSSIFFPPTQENGVAKSPEKENPAEISAIVNGDHKTIDVSISNSKQYSNQIRLFKHFY